MHQLIMKYAGAALLAVSAMSASAEVVPVELEEVRHQRATLVVAGSGGEMEYSQSDLEALGAVRMSTITPWRDAVTDFDGVLLKEVLAANGLSSAKTIRVIAENGYATEIDAEMWEQYTILLATRVNGRAHSRRARGPIQFVLPMSTSPELGAPENLRNWVWMAARIEVVN